MAGLLSQIRRLNGLGNTAMAEPFAGGAGASLKLLYLEETHQVFINDADPAIHDFWWSLVRRPDSFLKILSKSHANIAEWRRQRDIYQCKRKASRLAHGFATFYLNRCNRSGIIMNGGPIGGVKQAGKWKISARYNKLELIRRCKRVAEYRDRIFVSCQDGIDFLENLDAESTLFFIDPPYFIKGPTLYLNALDYKYHIALAERLEAMPYAAWVLTYDDCPEIWKIYGRWARIRPFSLRYTASERRRGHELLITPKRLLLPAFQPSNALTW